MKSPRLRPMLLLSLGLFLAPPTLAFAAEWQAPWEKGPAAREVVPIGLPSVTQAIAQTADGFLWFASMNGLFRFDGASPTPVDLGRGGPAVRVLLATRDGAVWVGAGGGYLDVPENPRGAYSVGLREGAGGLFRIKQGHITQILAPDGVAAHWIWAMSQLADGRVALGTEAGVWVVDGDGDGRRSPVRINLPHPQDQFIPALLAQTEAGVETLWIATTSGVWRWATDGKSLPTRALAEGGARALVASADGFWVVRDKRLVRVKEQSVVETIAAAPGEQLRCVLDDGKDEPWVGTTFGLRRLRAGKLVPAKEPLPQQSIRFLLRDREGSIWVSVKGGGVAQLRIAAIEQLGAAEGLPTDAAWSLLASAAGNSLWLATGKGLVKVANAKVDLHLVPPLSPNPLLRHLAQQSDGILWLGGDGLVRYSEGGSLSHSAAEIGGEVRALYVDGHEDVWFGLEPDGMATLPGGRIEQLRKYTVAEGLCSGIVNYIAPGSQNTLWLVGPRSVALFDKPTRRAKCFAENRPSALFQGAAEEPSGTTWLTAVGDSGLYRIKNNVLQAVPTNASFPPRALYAVLPDGHGNLWFTSNQGVYRLSVAELDQWTEGRGPAPIPFHVDHEAGMRSSDCQSRFSPTIVPWGDGGVVVATALGPVAIKPPEALPKPEVKPFIERLLVDGMPMDDARLVPAATRHVEIRYAAPTFLAGRRPRFEQRLEGLDSDWRPVAESRSVLLTKPGPGDYTFRLRPVGIYAQGAPEAWVRFRVEAPWFQRWPAIVGGILLIALLLYGAYKVRIRQLDARFTAISNERIRIARDWHDSLSQVFLGIGYQLQALRLRLFPHGEPAQHDPAIAALLDETKTMVKEAQEDVKAVLWDLRARNGENAFMEAFRILADETYERFGVLVELRTSGALPKAGPLTEEWPRIAKEAITNAIKHGEATKVRIGLEFQGGKATMTIEDDGKGLADSAKNLAPASSFGLIGMRERAERCGGKLSIEPRIPRGACVTVVVESPPHG